MIKKSSNFFEEHIEKLVLAVVGLLCVWLFVTRVVSSPNCVEYDNTKFAPGAIDFYISKQSQLLENKLDEKLTPKPAYNPRLPGFVALVDSAIGNIDVSIYPPVPPLTSREIVDDRQYRIPVIGEVNGVEVEHIRAVAYLPAEEITEENVYEKAKHEPNDIDFVTVEAKFGVAGLYERFNECFAGEDVQREWRDPCLAVPIFAAVDLQRQEQLGDGGWSDWQVVPRPKIDHRRSLFDIIEDIEELPPGGVEVRLLQYDDPVVREALLQPEAYRIASAEEDWYPPLLHREYIEVRRKEDVEERRKKIAEEKKKEEQEKNRGRTTRTRTRGAGRGGAQMGEAGMIMQMFGSSMPGGGSGMPGGSSLPKGRGLGSSRVGRGGRQVRGPQRRPGTSVDTSKQKPKPTVTTRDIEGKFGEMLLAQKKNLAKLKEPIVLWAHDDTVGAGKNYRYRMRLGVLNPTAGKDWFYEQDEHLKNQVILWSKFSDVTETVEIPERLYLFARNIQEAAKTVTVQVCRYALGYWYSNDFKVRPGEVIGKVVENETVQQEQRTRKQGAGLPKQGLQEQQETKQEGVVVPEKIDYSTGAVLVDVVSAVDWSGGKKLRARPYFDMLYSSDGMEIEHMPVNSAYWANDVQIAFNEVQRSLKEAKKPLRPWSGRRRGGTVTIPGMKGRGPKGGSEAEMIMKMFEGMFNK